MSCIHKHLNVQQLQTSSFHPQTNGLTERFNKTLVGILSMYVSAHQKDWDELLPFASYAYNTSTHPSTNESPFFLMFGRDPNMVEDITPENEMENDAMTVERYRSDLVTKMVKVHREVEYFNNLVYRRDFEQLRRPESKEISSLEIWYGCTTTV